MIRIYTAVDDVRGITIRVKIFRFDAFSKRAASISSSGTLFIPDKRMRKLYPNALYTATRLMMTMTRPGVFDHAGSVTPAISATAATGPETGLNIHWNKIAPTTKAISDDEKRSVL